MGKQEPIDSNSVIGSEVDTLSIQSKPQSPTVSEPCDTFEVITKGLSPTSGFEYHPQLFEMQVPPGEWTRFSDELVHALRLTPVEKAASWTVGITVGLVVAVPLVVFGASPATYAGRKVKTKSIESKVTNYMDDVGELVTVLQRWNDTFFKERGFSVKLALPKKDSPDYKKEDTSKFREYLNRKNKNKDGDHVPSKKKVKKLDSRYRLIVDIAGNRKAAPKASPSDVKELEGDAEQPLFKGGVPLRELDAGARGGEVIEASSNPVYELA